MTDPAPQLLAAKLETLHEDVGEIRTALRELTNAVTRLALVEERQTQAAAALERAFKALGVIESRVSEIEKKVPEVTRASVWMDRAVMATCGAALMYVAKSTGLLG